jgi:hypothetical protein
MTLQISRASASYKATIVTFFHLATINGWDAPPGAPISLAALLSYISHLRLQLQKRSLKFQSAISYISALSHYHEVNGVSWPVRNHPQVRAAIKFQLRSVRPIAPPRQDHAINLNELHSLCIRVDQTQLNEVLLATICTSLFFGLGRISELVHSSKHLPMRETSIIREEGSYKFFLEQPKTRRQETQHISPRRTGGIVCPQFWIHLYLSFIRPKPQWLWTMADGSRITHSWICTSFLRISQCTFIPGECSFRAGGATFFARNSVPLDQICLLGRWSSDAWRRYIRSHSITLLGTLDYDFAALTTI